MFYFILGCKARTTQIYKLDVGYIIREVECLSNSFNKPLTVKYRLKDNFGIYYVALKKQMDIFFQNDSLDTSGLTILVDQFEWLSYDSNRQNHRVRLTHTVELENIFTLDNVNIYKIGNKYYAILKMEYAYNDNIYLYRSLYMRELDTQGDDFHIDERVSEDSLKNTYIDLKTYVHKDYYRYFLFLKELLPPDRSVKRHIWKKKYELSDFFIYIS
jgi:hypothetical protein